MRVQCVGCVDIVQCDDIGVLVGWAVVNLCGDVDTRICSGGRRAHMAEEPVHVAPA